MQKIRLRIPAVVSSIMMYNLYNTPRQSVATYSTRVSNKLALELHN